MRYEKLKAECLRTVYGSRLSTSGLRFIIGCPIAVSEAQSTTVYIIWTACRRESGQC